MPTPADNLRINGERLWSTIHEIAEIGPGVRGGSNRQTLTDADRDGRLLFKRWCEDAGLSVGVDSMGTMFARRKGADESLPPVLVGSHLDTQPTGGRYDGVLGVLGGLELVRTLNDKGKLRQDIAVEEVRRSVPFFGSTAGEGGWTWLGRYWGPLAETEGPVQDEWSPVLEFRLPRARYAGNLDVSTLLRALLKIPPLLSAAEQAAWQPPAPSTQSSPIPAAHSDALKPVSQ